jgi:transposase-like protein
MRRYSKAVKADVRRRISPPQRQSVAQISAEMGIHVVTLYGDFQERCHSLTAPQAACINGSCRGSWSSSEG